MLKSTTLLALALFSLSSVAGCAAEPDEALDSANGAYTFASALTSPLPDGLYSDGAGSYIRATSHLLTQQVEWATASVTTASGTYGFESGSGRADVPRPGADNFTVTQEWSNVTRTLSIAVSPKKDKLVVEESATNRTPTFKRSFSPVAYKSLDASYGAQTEPTPTSKLDADGVDTTSDYGVTIQKATEEGLDLVVTGPRSDSSSAHFTWDRDALELTATSCGKLTLSLGGSSPILRVLGASNEQGCEVFSALRAASTLGLGQVHLQKR